MRPFVLVEVENDAVSDTTVVGDSQVSVIVVDWDTVDGDADAARELLDEVEGRFPNNEIPYDSDAMPFVRRLKEIIDEADEEDDDDFDDEEDDDEGDDLDLDDDFEDDEDDDTSLSLDEFIASDTGSQSADNDEGRILGGPGLGRG